MISRNMKIPLAAVIGGLVALALRIWNLRAGFEDANGLPISGHPSFPAMALVLALTLGALWILSRPLAHAAPRFPFIAAKRPAVAPAVAGAFLFALAGLADLYEASTGKKLLSQTLSYEYAFEGLIGGESVGVSPAAQAFGGLLTLLSAWAAFECIRACLRGNPRFRAAILIPAVALSFRLVSVYRLDSVNPVLEDYAPVLIALIFQTLGFYALSAFPFECGNLRKFAVFSGGAVATTLCVLADDYEYVSTSLTLAGSALSLTGLLLLALDAPTAHNA